MVFYFKSFRLEVCFGIEEFFCVVCVEISYKDDFIDGYRNKIVIGKIVQGKRFFMILFGYMVFNLVIFLKNYTLL